jgi:SAM-dependent methyltransferase
MKNKKFLSSLLCAAAFFLFDIPSCCAIDTAVYFPDLQPDADGRIETLNNEGGMAPTATGAELWLLEDLKKGELQNARLLEIGPAFGRLPIELFTNGFSGQYTAIDLSEDHLHHLHEALKKLEPSPDSVHSMVGRFPDATQSLPSNSFDIIVVTHVFHFLDPQQLNQSLEELYRLLVPEGKVYLTLKTPYSTRYRNFIPVYEDNVREGRAHPGYMESVAMWVDPATVTPEKFERLKSRHLYFFSKEDLKNVFEEHYFEVVLCDERPLSYSSPIWEAPAQYEGREEAAIVAVKPTRSKN